MATSLGSVEATDYNAASAGNKVSAAVAPGVDAQALARELRR